MADPSVTPNQEEIERRKLELKAANEILGWAKDPVAAMPTDEERRWARDVIAGSGQ